MHTDSDGTYGSSCVHALLRREGVQVGRKQIGHR
ncbi:IS3 family transposase [Streptomyces sp. CBMA123]